MGLSALSSPTSGLSGNSLDRTSSEMLSTPESLGSVWHPRPVDKESMARITQYFTEASLATHGDIDFEEPKTSRSLGYLNIASETSTEDEFAGEMSFHNSVAARSQPRLVCHVDNSEDHPTIVVDFRPIEPMPTSPSIKPKSKGKHIDASPSRSLDKLPSLTKTNNFVQEAKELYSSRFGAEPNSQLQTHYEAQEPAQQGYYKNDFGISAQEVYNKGSSFWKSYHAPLVMTATSQSSSVKATNEQYADHIGGPTINEDKYKLRPTLQTPPFPTDFTINPKLSVHSEIPQTESTEKESVYDGASSSNMTDVHMNNITREYEQEQKERPQSVSPCKGGIEREQYMRHSRQSSHPVFGANNDIPDPPSYNQAFQDTKLQSILAQSPQQKKDFSCCSLGRDPLKQQPLQHRDDVADTTGPAPSSPGRKRQSRHYRSNSTPFPSPCNFIDILADDPNTPRDPYNHYHITTSQPSLANATSTDRISTHSTNEFSNIGNRVVTSSSAGNIPRGTDTSEPDLKEASATLGKQPKKTRYIKNKQSPSNHSFGALSGLTGSSSSGTTLAASSGKSSETLRADGQSPEVSLESRLQYFFRQQAEAEGLIPAEDHQLVASNLGVGQILPSLLTSSGRGSSYSVTGELMLGLQPGIGDQSLVLNIVKAKDISDQFIDLSKKREWHCIVSYQDYKKTRNKQFRSHAVKAIYDPVFHEIFGVKVNSLEGLVQVKLLCRKGIFSQKKKVGSIYLSLERIPFENYENGELVAWYKLLKRR